VLGDARIVHMVLGAGEGEGEGGGWVVVFVVIPGFKKAFSKVGGGRGDTLLRGGHYKPLFIV